jgi:hypothetical protein
MTPDEARQRAAASRAKQGLPPTISDPMAIAAVAAMVADTLLGQAAVEHQQDGDGRGEAA